MRKRKTLRLLVTVTVPRGMSPLDARREVRTMINNHSNWRNDYNLGDVRAAKVVPATEAQFYGEIDG